MFWLLGVALLVGLAAAVWFGTAGVRTERAIAFDEQSRTALEQGDLGAAYRDGQFAYALVPRAERALTLGALAYLREDYAAAREHFRAAGSGSDGDDEGGAHTRALVGLAAAAARSGDYRGYERAMEAAGEPSSDGSRLALAAAAIQAGDLERARGLLTDVTPDTRNAAFITAVARAGDDVTAARKALSGSGRSLAAPSFPDPAYERLIARLIAVPEDGIRNLGIALGRMAAAADKTSRTVALASLLNDLGNYRAAERLAREGAQETPDYRDAWNVLAAAQISLREFAEAERSLKISTDLDASYGYTWYLRAQLAEATGKQSQAEEFRKRADLLGFEKR